jgi:hypothetical protein
MVEAFRIGGSYQERVKIMDKDVAPPVAPVTGDKVLQAIIDFATKSMPDVQNALDLATKNNNHVTIQAWTALLAFMQKVTTINTNLPPVHLATDIELLTELTQDLQPGSVLVTAFAPLAAYQNQQAASLVTGIVTGVIGLGKLIPMLPVIP